MDNSKVRKVLIVPTAYKGTLSPQQVAWALAKGVNDRGWHSVVAPLADGGDGTIETLHRNLGGKIEQCKVTGPLDHPVLANWLDMGNWAVIELAQASGIAHLQNSQLQPLLAHTYGLGELILHCIDRGFKQIAVTLGGSASTDGGTGALSALGAKFYDSSGKIIALGGGGLINLNSCDLSPVTNLVDKVAMQLVVDINNPLLGPQGAAVIYAPQKGANAQEIDLLESGLSNLANILEAASCRRLRKIPGAGAAGGSAFGLACVLGAKIMSGFTWLADLLDLERKIEDCDLVISAEGKLDSQSLSGKAIGELAKICQRIGRPLWVLPACAEPGINWTKFGIERVIVTATQGKSATTDDITRAVLEL